MMTRDHRRRWEQLLWVEHLEPGMLEHTLHWTIAKCNSLGIFCGGISSMDTARWATGFIDDFSVP